MSFLLSLGLTLLLEGAVALTWAIRGKDILLFALANILTNPPALLLHLLFPGWGMVMAVELGAILVEGSLYKELGRAIRRPWSFALFANAVSFTAGLWLDAIL